MIVKINIFWSFLKSGDQILLDIFFKNYKKKQSILPLNYEPTNMSSITGWSHFITKGCFVQWQARGLRCCYYICLESKSNGIPNLKLINIGNIGVLNFSFCNFFLDVIRADRDGVQTGCTYMSVIIVPWFARFSIFGAMTFQSAFILGKLRTFRVEFYPVNESPGVKQGQIRWTEVN